MNGIIENLNGIGERLLSIGWPLLWQSSLLMVIVFCLDYLFAKKVRAAVRYALWLVVLVKLLLPPTLALPTGAAWWLIHAKSVAPPPAAKQYHYTVTYDDTLPPLDFDAQNVPLPPPPSPKLELAGWLLLAAVTVSMVLLLWMTVRWWQVTRVVRKAKLLEGGMDILTSARALAKRRFAVRLKMVEGRMSPAVCGLFRPVILLPRELTEKLSSEQLRAVLLHELFHLRRGDVWVNCAQALLQIFYWWHPLLWFANARIRRLREEAVDDAVMLALRDAADSYAPTLLEVAKLAFRRPLLSLGLVGIMESRSALRQRIERLVDFRAPHKAGLTFLSFIGIFVFSAVALPMGEAPAPMPQQTFPITRNANLTIPNTNVTVGTITGILSDPNFRMVLHALKQRSGAENLAEPEVTTTSGRSVNWINPSTISVSLSNAYSSNSSPIVASSSTDEMVRANALVQEGKLLYETGNLDGAEAKLKAALALDPQNKAAGYYLGLVQPTRKRQKQETIKPDRQTIVEDLNRIRFDQFGPFDELSLGEVASKLSKAAGITVSVEESSIVNLPVHMPLPLENVSLQEALDAVILHVSKPVKYFILNGQVAFTSKDEAPALFTRTFRVDTRSFVSSLKQTGVELGDATNSPAAISKAVRNFFGEMGVNWQSPPGKSCFFNDQSGILFVRATSADLDLVERAAEALNYMAPQIHIKARFLEVPPGTVADFGSLLNSTNAQAQSFTGVLDTSNMKTALQSLAARQGVATLAEPEATTSSGRQVQMRATQVITVVSNFVFQESVTNNGTGAVVPQMAQVETGPILDVLPRVLPDGRTINLVVTPSLTEFWGYATPPDVPDVTGTNNRVQLPVILPQFTTRKVTTSLNLWDGQTVVVGGLPQINHFTHKTPVLGSVPLIGRLFKTDNATTNEMLVLITATIVDSAGNRVHSDADMKPIIQNGIPPQPSPAIPGYYDSPSPNPVGM